MKPDYLLCDSFFLLVTQYHKCLLGFIYYDAGHVDKIPVRTFDNFDFEPY